MLKDCPPDARALFMLMITKIDDDEWSRSGDDGSGYSNDGDKRVD